MARGLVKRKPKKTKVTKTQARILNKNQYGDEPEFAGEPSKLEMIETLNWYNVMCDKHEARQFLEDYFDFVERPALKKNLNWVPDVWIPKTAAWVVRMMVRGIEVPSSSKEYVKKELQYVFNKFQKQEQPVEQEIKYPVRDKVKERIDEILIETGKV